MADILQATYPHVSHVSHLCLNDSELQIVEVTLEVTLTVAREYSSTMLSITLWDNTTAIRENQITTIENEFYRT